MEAFNIYPEYQIAKIEKTEPVKVHLLPVKWTPEAVVKYIKECRAGKGIPMFFTRYAGEQYKADGKLAARSSCWGGSDSGSVFWVGVPKEDIEMMERTKGDWRALLIKYAPEEFKLQIPQFPPELKELYEEESRVSDIEKAIKMLKELEEYKLRKRREELEKVV